MDQWCWLDRLGGGGGEDENSYTMPMPRETPVPNEEMTVEQNSGELSDEEKRLLLSFKQAIDDRNAKEAIRRANIAGFEQWLAEQHRDTGAQT